MEYIKVCAAISAYLNKNQDDESPVSNVFLFKKMNVITLSSKQIRQKLVVEKCKTIKSFDYWEEQYPNKTKEFIYKTFYEAINIENRLKTIGISNGVCKVCSLSLETQKHMFLECKKLLS